MKGIRHAGSSIANQGGCHAGRIGFGDAPSRDGADGALRGAVVKPSVNR